MRKISIVPLISLTLGVSSLAQTSPKKVETKISGHTRVLQIMKADEKVVIDGKIFSIAELRQVLASADNESALHLRSQETQSRDLSVESAPKSKQCQLDSQDCPN